MRPLGFVNYLSLNECLPTSLLRWRSEGRKTAPVSSGSAGEGPPRLPGSGKIPARVESAGSFPGDFICQVGNWGLLYPGTSLACHECLLGCLTGKTQANKQKDHEVAHRSRKPCDSVQLNLPTPFRFAAPVPLAIPKASGFLSPP